MRRCTPAVCTVGTTPFLMLMLPIFNTYGILFRVLLHLICRCAHNGAFYTETKVVLLKDPDSIIENQGNQSRKS
jgi:hypothetical protein